MSNEARVIASLTVRKVSGSTVLLDYASRPGSFSADVTGTRGPNPGTVIATAAGTDVDLSGLTDPGWCHLHNQDTTGYVEFGVWDTETSTFFPLLELLPGQSMIIQLSRNFGEDQAAGTGTTAATNRLRVKTYGGTTGEVFVGAFER